MTSLSQVPAATSASLEGAGPDFARMRMQRRERLFDAMAAHDLDALVLSRPANVAYASGARLLWTGGARAFSPGCVVVASTRHIHLMSTWDEGVPRDIGHDDLYGLTWNPANIVASLQGIAGLTTARRIGTDSLTPAFPSMLGAVAPGAELVDGRAANWAARTTKTADELACVITAAGIAEAALAAMIDAVRPGTTERELVGVYLESIASAGFPCPPTEGVACVIDGSAGGGKGSREHRFRRLATDRPIMAAHLVALDAGALFAGYEGGVGRTWPADVDAPPPHTTDLAARCRDALDTLVAACRPGESGRAIKEAWLSTGQPLPDQPLVHGLGLGMEPPLITATTGDDATLQEGMVVAATAWVTDERRGQFFERDTVFVGGDGPVVISRFGRGPFERG